MQPGDGRLELVEVVDDDVGRELAHRRFRVAEADADHRHARRLAGGDVDAAVTDHDGALLAAAGQRDGAEQRVRDGAWPSVERVASRDGDEEAAHVERIEQRPRQVLHLVGAHGELYAGWPEISPAAARAPRTAGSRPRCGCRNSPDSAPAAPSCSGRCHRLGRRARRRARSCAWRRVRRTGAASLRRPAADRDGRARGWSRR